MENQGEGVWDTVRVTDYARLTENPLRKLTQGVKIDPNPDKKVITLQLGDPSIFGNFPIATETLEALKRALVKDKFPYNNSTGILEAREAIAEYSRHQGIVTSSDVILSSGCSAAVEMCILALVCPYEGENMLIPRPCYNYKTWTVGLRIETRSYNLDPTKNWDIDLKHMESLIDSKTKAILINNPSNPTGSVFNKDHLLKILAIAEKYRITIIADDIYENFVFPGVEYASISSLSMNVPVLSCSGLSKRFLMPGIRMGWIVIHDKQNALKDVRQGLINISGRILGPNSTVQLALPEILKNTPQSYFDNAMEKFAHHAITAYNLFKDIPGLNPIKPKGAMYMMIGIDLKSFPQFSSCLEFTQAIIREQSVLTFPGNPCFDFPGFMRIVLTVPDDMIINACDRIKEFCVKYFVNHP